MTLQADERPFATAPRPGRTALRRTVQIAPWIVFGPITGILSGLAFRCLRNRQPGLAALCILANVAIVAAIPLLTLLLASRA